MTAFPTTFRTTTGPVRGALTAPDTVAVRGIPYAAPPFGPDRFRAPRPPRPWAGVRDCTRFGPVAPQSARLPGAPHWSPGDEDVLTLNVWTPARRDPARADGGLPVLVWIHGGAYTFGSSAQPDFDGTTLCRAGLVVVTVNYRVGFEGFGHVPPAGAGDERHPDNRGLLDQIAALGWVRDTIASFGGDPGNVTVAGQSAGASSVACLLVVDAARGLFRRAIAHSPVNSCSSVALAAETTRRVAAAAGVPATAEGLLSASPQALVAASDEVVDAYRRDPDAGPRHYDPVLYAPVADGRLLAADPLATTAGGTARAAHPRPGLLVCHTDQEYWLLDAVGSSAKVCTEEQLARFAADFGLAAGLVKEYRELMPGAPVPDVHLALFGDLVFGEYGRRLAGAYAASGGRAHLSRFARRRTDAEGGAVLPWHCADVPFAFGTLADESVRFLIGGAPDAADHQLSRRMVASWASFAATGDPGWEPLGASGEGPVHVWTTSGSDGGAGDTERIAAFRRAWRTYGFPLLEP
ncbi:carboxylesterase/lipase family protein [Streptomyces sp. t39]|uniref:carboxylesterase/lipase family protein n=1 Tax=Streptomyces sp. t39 TaxID=1828156 RepID=UPI0011CE653C|nr:carboxylesterase family protein [Streptomyces sp. t39]TXS57477.1 carboxylesterase/lipase family protein [Streptomyces sp. t39]